MKASMFLNSIAMRTLYSSLFLPYINYCCEVWGLTNKRTIDPLVKLQKKAIRIVSKVGKYEHTNGLFYQLKLLKFVDLVYLKVGIIMFKARINKLPVKVQEKFSLNINTNYSLRSVNKFKVKYVRTALKAKTLSIYGVKIFNTISFDMNKATNVLRFKALFKKKV